MPEFESLGEVQALVEGHVAVAFENRVSELVASYEISQVESNEMYQSLIFDEMGKILQLKKILTQKISTDDLAEHIQSDL